jgi:hypothetical protein
MDKVFDKHRKLIEEFNGKIQTSLEQQEPLPLPSPIVVSLPSTNSNYPDAAIVEKLAYDFYHS